MSSEMASSSCRTTSERKMVQLDTALSALEGLSLSVSSTLVEDNDDDGDSQTVSTREETSGLRRFRSSRTQSALDLSASQEKLRRIFPSIPPSLRRMSQLPKNANCRCRCHGEALTGNAPLTKTCSQCVKIRRQYSPWRYRPYIGVQQSENATTSNSGGKLRRTAADKSEISHEQAESLRTLMAAAKVTEFELDELNLTLRSSTLIARSSSSCGAEARSREDRVTVDELAAYFDEFLNLPRKMSPLAESMYA